MTERDDEMRLEAVLAEVRQTPRRAPAEALTAAILADAAAGLAGQGTGGWLSVLGGWPAAAGLAAAAVTGLAVGLAAPGTLSTLAGEGTVEVALFPEIAALGAEG